MKEFKKVFRGKMKTSNKYMIIGLLCLLTAFPLGTFYKPLILIPSIGCGIFILFSEYIFGLEFKQELNDIKKEKREKLLQENEEYYASMQLADK